MENKLRYIGSKSLLLEYIENIINSKALNTNSLCDIFSGTSIVARYFKKNFEIISNDLLHFSYVLQKATIENEMYPEFKEIKKYLGEDPFNHFEKIEVDLNMIAWSKLNIFHKSIIDSMRHLKSSGHIVIFIKDLQPKGKELNLLHADIIKDLNTIDNLKYLGTKIWADQSVNLYPYRYPFHYVSNQIHQYILIFKKD